MSNELPGSQPEKDPTTHARDTDPSTGEPVHSVEPGQEGEAQTDATVERQGTAEPELTNEERVSAKLFKDDVRNAIAARRQGMTLEERQAFAKEQPEEFQASELVAGADAGSDAAPEATSAPATPAQPAIASNQKTHKIRVYGKDVAEVSEEDVIQAGIKALQKTSAADTRMQQAATREAQLVTWEGQLQTFADNLSKGLDMEGRPINPAGGPGTTQPPAPGVAGAIDRAKLREAQAALLRGDDEASAETLAEIIQAAIAAGKPAAEPAEAPRKIEVPARPAGIGDSWGREQQIQANAVFNDEFMDLSDAQFRLAQTQMQSLMADPANKGKPLVDLARTAGTAIRQALGASHTPAAPAVPGQQILEDRRVLKARIPVTPPAGSARAPSGQAAPPRYPTNAEHVRALQLRNGSNSSPRPPARR